MPTESFLGFFELTDLTGEAIASALIKCMIESGLDLSRLIGQAYDGAAAMKGRL